MDRKLALETLVWCDQIEQALADGNQDVIDLVRGKLIHHFAYAQEVDIRAAVECARARADQVLNPKEHSDDDEGTHQEGP